MDDEAAGTIPRSTANQMTGTENKPGEQPQHDDMVIDPTAPVGIEMVRAAIKQLEATGQAVTRRAVRGALGKGSLRTIHNLMVEIETVREQNLDRIDLTDEDRRVILDFGARVFSVMRWRLEDVTKAREGALQKQIDEFRQRAVEVINLADAEVADAKAAVETAAARQNEAELARTAAEAEALRLEKESERAAGQVALLLEEREEMRRRLEGTEERLTRAVAAQEAEAEEVVRLEQRVSEQKSEIDSLRAGREDLLRQLGNKDVDIAKLQRDCQMHTDTVLEVASKLKVETDGHLATKAELAKTREKVVQLEEKASATGPVVAELHSTLYSERLRADKAERELAETRGSDVAVEQIKRLLETMQVQDKLTEKERQKRVKKTRASPKQG